MDRLNRKDKLIATNRIGPELVAYAILFSECRRLKDRTALLSHLLKVPLRLLYKAFRKNFSRNLSRDIMITNASGTFLCGRSLNTCRIASSFHEKVVQRHIRLQRGVFIDVGSHIGKYTIPVARVLDQRGTVVSLEPEPDNFSLLRRNLALNHLSNVHAFQMACSSEDGEAVLYVDPVATTLHSLHIEDACREKKRIRVQTARLDTIIRTLALDRVDLIKIDTEGAELEVLEGSKTILGRHHPRIVFEAWNATYLDAIRHFLDPFGYRITPLDKTNHVAS